jgi:hypothetical protein
MAREHVVKILSDLTAFVEENCTDECVLFRGQPHDHPLLPRIARLSLQDDLAKVERTMLAEFKRQSTPYLGHIPDNNWDWLALAQHHGMATRLLDWTKNPLAALWFVVQRPPSSDSHGVLWVFTPDTHDVVTADEARASPDGPFEGTRTKVFQPNCVTERIVAQAGWFTVHKYLREKSQFMPLEEYEIHKEHLVKLTVPAKAFAELRYQLDRFGVNNASLFPDLDGICRHVEWVNSVLADEKATTEMPSSRNAPARRKDGRRHRLEQSKQGQGS